MKNLFLLLALVLGLSTLNSQALVFANAFNGSADDDGTGLSLRAGVTQLNYNDTFLFNVGQTNADLALSNNAVVLALSNTVARVEASNAWFLSLVFLGTNITCTNFGIFTNAFQNTTTNRAIAANDYYLGVDTTSSNITIILADDILPGQTKVIFKSASANILIVDPVLTQTIDGQLTQSLTNNGDCIIVFKTGVNTFSIIADNRGRGSTYSTSLTVGGGATITKFLTATASLNFPVIASINDYEDLTVTVTGAALGDVVSLGIPAASLTGNWFFETWVSSANTVTVRCLSHHSSSLNPATGTFRVMVTQF